MPDPKIRWRGMHADDTGAVQALLAACGRDIGEAELRGLQQMLGDSLDSNTRLAQDESGQAIAFGFLMLRPEPDGLLATLPGYVHPGYLRQGLGGELLDWQLAQILEAARAQDAGKQVTLQVEAGDSCAGCGPLYESRGFNLWLTHCQMRLDLAKALPEHTLPEGIRLQAYAAEHSEDMRKVFNRAFAQHWIGELDPDAWKARFIDTEKFRPDLTQMAFEQDRLVGFYLSEVLPDQPQRAWLEVVGVLPDQRGRGLGTALTTHAMRGYQEAGFNSSWLSVDDENATGAKRIYERLGYQQMRTDRIFLKQIAL